MYPEIRIASSGSRDDGAGHPGHEPIAMRHDPSSVKVLVVEDEWFISMEIEAILSGAGYQVAAVATSTAEAVSLAERHAPDLILMDIRLRGEGDGIDAAIEIRRRLGHRCVFVTAHTDQSTRQRAAIAEPLGWVVKPFTDRQLLEAVRLATDAETTSSDDD